MNDYMERFGEKVAKLPSKEIKEQIEKNKNFYGNCGCNYYAKEYIFLLNKELMIRKLNNVIK